MKLRLLSTVLTTSIIWLVPLRVWAADFTITSFAGDYHLDKDSTGVSVLTVEEAIGISFPSTGSKFSGINRAIPTRYLKHDVELKLTSVTDTSGNSVPYRTTYDKDRNLIVNIGNPQITVFGQQIYNLRYQAKGIVNFLGEKEEFYPNFNGRGWDQSFDSIFATIHMPEALAHSLKTQPQCLIDEGKCSITTEKKGSETVITAKAQNSLNAHQSLTAKLDFKKGTFKPFREKKLMNYLKTVGIFVGALTGLLAVANGIKTALKFIWKKPINEEDQR